MAFTLSGTPKRACRVVRFAHDTNPSKQLSSGIHRKKQNPATAPAAHRKPEPQAQPERRASSRDTSVLFCVTTSPDID